MSTLSAHGSLDYVHPVLIQRLQEKESLTDADARQLFHDMLRFLYLCGTYDGTLVPSKRIDTAWHHFILFTRDYDAFCREHFGRFIHHSPQAPSDGSSGRLFQLTCELARLKFGELSENWAENCYCKTNCNHPICSSDPPPPPEDP